jgi:methanethiol S-methyltransferase
MRLAAPALPPEVRRSFNLAAIERDQTCGRSELVFRRWVTTEVKRDRADGAHVHSVQLSARLSDRPGGNMWRSMARVMGATVLYGLVHSALASRPAKSLFARVTGQRNRNGLYRVFYIAQSVGTFGLLAAIIHRQRAVEIYRVRGPLALLMHGGQAAGLLLAIASARQVGFDRITGLRSLGCWYHGVDPPPEPEAQGPALDQEGLGRAPGPFAWSRHPLNLAPLPVFWLWPRMNSNLLAFNLAATAYLIVGSLHEEIRLREAFGEAYRTYQQSGVSFYFPVTPRRRVFDRISVVEPSAAEPPAEPTS